MSTNLRVLVFMLPTSLMRMRASPTENLQVSPFELTYGRPFLRIDLLMDEDRYRKHYKNMETKFCLLPDKDTNTNKLNQEMWSI